jgi:hypothetical protein
MLQCAKICGEKKEAIAFAQKRNSTKIFQPTQKVEERASIHSFIGFIFFTIYPIVSTPLYLMLFRMVGTVTEGCTFVFREQANRMLGLYTTAKAESWTCPNVQSQPSMCPWYVVQALGWHQRVQAHILHNYGWSAVLGL